MKSVFLYLGLITQLGLAVVISIMAGLFVGISLDKFFHTRMIFTIIFIIFGVIGGFIAAYKLIGASPEEKNGRATDNSEKN